MFIALGVRRPTARLVRPALACLFLVLFGVGGTRFAAADTLQVPADHPTIQSAIDAAVAGDTIVVDPGTYRERVRLKPGVTLRSAGDDAKGVLGMKRAEATIINGDAPGAEGPGVALAEGSTIDGFTVTGVGTYDDAKWQKHHATRGETQSHEHIGQPGTAGISVDGVTSCTVSNNIVHHIGYTGIAILGTEGKRVAPHIVRNIAYRNMGGGIGSMHGSTATIESNICFENFYAGIGHNDASPLVTFNVCYANIRAGIGISEHARPIVRQNHCYENRRAGIGVRTGKSTAPLIEWNDCHDNGMAGIGARDEARPIIRKNRCHRNGAAGIGCRTGARPLIEQNECFENALSGIGVQSGARAVIIDNECRANKTSGIGVRDRATALILDNTCLENKAVAIGVQAGSTAHIEGNRLVRTDGMPPMIVVHGDASATIVDNVIRGGGVAGVMVQGTATISGNEFQGNGPRRGGPPNYAAWARTGSNVTFADNRIDGWRHALLASGAARIRATDNVTQNFIDAAIVVTDTSAPAHVHGNVAFSENAGARSVRITGPQGVVASNTRQAAPEAK